MSALKRKDAPGAAVASKEGKTHRELRPLKRPKSDKSAAKPAASTGPNPVVAKLKDEEPLFPRGGGSVLTPLEHKQIHIQAKNDVLFEQETAAGQKSTAKGAKPKKKARSKSNAGESKGVGTGDEETVKIESLNYKRLVKGSLVLGQVSAIHPLEIVLTLPNNITGNVPITAISPMLTEKLQSAVAEDEGSVESDDDDGVDLKTLFEVGQYVRAYVVSTTEDNSDGAGKAKRRITLSLQPALANEGLTGQDVVENCTLMAAVVSVEDHGFVMDLGIGESTISGFLPRKQVGASFTDERMQPGNVLLCTVTRKSANGQVAQLSLLPEKLGRVENHAGNATTINSFLPGTAAEVLISDVSDRGVVGSIMGHLDVTADSIHSGLGSDGVDLEAKYKIGSKIKARVICTFPAAKNPKLGISLLPHITALKTRMASEEGSEKAPLDALPISSLVDRCTVVRVEPDIGLFVDIGLQGVAGFVHISRVKDGKVDALFENSGPYKVGSVHRGRVVGYNSIDGLFLLSFEQHVLDQPYLRIEDVPIGEVINGTVERLVIKEDGVNGIIVKITEGISGLAPAAHLADVRLQHPEMKFKEGMKVRARVLSTDASKHQVRVTLKKSLVNSELPAIHSFDQVSTGLQTVGTIFKVLSNGAIIQFYGKLRGFLPLSEMSEAYIHDPKEHFREGQVVNVHVLDFDPETNRLVVSCKNPAAFGMEKQKALNSLKIGDLVSGKVTEKTEDDVFVELDDSSLRAMLPVGHLTDRSSSKNQAALKRIRVGQTLSELVVVEKNDGRRSITLSQKPSLVKAGREGKLLWSADNVKVGDVMSGFIRNITPTAVFVQFGGKLTALLPKAKLSRDVQGEENFGMHKLQSLQVKVSSIDRDHGRIFVTLPSDSDENARETDKSADNAASAVNPIDSTIGSIQDLTVGRITTARIVDVKETQLNVKLADNIQGRVDVSQAFDSWDEISDPKAPLQRFHTKQIIRVRVLGVHDARNHRFLPISHRSGHSVLELSAKPSDLKEDVETEPLSWDTLTVGSTWLAFVNNIGKNCLWANLSPNVRGRISAMEASEDLSQIKDLENNFPLGSALRVRVSAVDIENKRLDLSARSSSPAKSLTWDTIEQNMVVAGKITRVNDRHIMVQLGENLAGPVQLVDLADDYDEAKPLSYTKHDIVRVAVVELDKSNKKIRLSARPSRVLNSSLPVRDREITDIAKVHVGDIVRGFVRSVDDKGLFVNLGGSVTPMVRISDISDKFIKNWKDQFRVDQLVKGRVMQVDPESRRILLSLKASVVDEDYVPPITIFDLKEGQNITGKVRKVEEYGAFIVLDGTENVTGLCHRSEMAEDPVRDARKLYSEGDVVKARILKIDTKQKKINLGLKLSYFKDADEDEAELGDSDEDDDEAGGAIVQDEDEDNEDDEDEDEVMREAGGSIFITGTDMLGAEDEDEQDDDDADINMTDAVDDGISGLEAGGFDWNASTPKVRNANPVEKGTEPATAKPRKNQREARIQVDKTGELDVNGPQTASDYERRLLGEPDSSELWIAYMAFQMQVSELAKAREVAERAIKTINMREEGEKLNVWTAYLNLEIAYGSPETADKVFERARQFNDEQEIYERYASIHIKSGKHQKAEQLFEEMAKKFGVASPQFWINYAHFLHATINSPDRARLLLKRATSTLRDQQQILPLTTKFAALEFRSPNGDPEFGRTLFAGILATYPKRFDLWDQLVDLETSTYATAEAKRSEQGSKADLSAAPVRDVFERGTKVKGLKDKRAKAWFRKWAKWEEENGDAQSRQHVSARAQQVAKEIEARKQDMARKKDDDGEGDGED